MYPKSLPLIVKKIKLKWQKAPRKKPKPPEHKKLNSRTNRSVSTIQFANSLQQSQTLSWFTVPSITISGFGTITITPDVVCRRCHRLVNAAIDLWVEAPSMIGTNACKPCLAMERIWENADSP